MTLLDYNASYQPFILISGIQESATEKQILPLCFVDVQDPSKPAADDGVLVKPVLARPGILTPSRESDKATSATTPHIVTPCMESMDTILTLHLVTPRTGLTPLSKKLTPVVEIVHLSTDQGVMIRLGHDEQVTLTHFSTASSSPPPTRSDQGIPDRTPARQRPQRFSPTAVEAILSEG